MTWIMDYRSGYKTNYNNGSLFFMECLLYANDQNIFLQFKDFFGFKFFIIIVVQEIVFIKCKLPCFLERFD